MAYSFDGFGSLSLIDRSLLEEKLVERKVPHDQAAALSQLCDSLEEASSVLFLM